MSGFGKSLEFLRKKNHMGQRELASRIGVSRQTIYNWELDICRPKPANIISLCACFGLSEDYFVKYGMPPVTSSAIASGDWTDQVSAADDVADGFAAEGAEGAPAVAADSAAAGDPCPHSCARAAECGCSRRAREGDERGLRSLLGRFMALFALMFAALSAVCALFAVAGASSAFSHNRGDVVATTFGRGLDFFIVMTALCILAGMLTVICAVSWWRNR